MFKNKRLRKLLMDIDDDIRSLISDLEKINISENDRVLTLEKISILAAMRIQLIDNKEYRAFRDC